MIVMKFGGTSVESAQAIQRVVGIIASRADRKPVVVVSAMGHTTDHLLAIAEAAVQGKRGEALDQLSHLRQSHLHEATQVAAGIRPRKSSKQFLEEHYHELAKSSKAWPRSGNARRARSTPSRASASASRASC